MKSNTVITYTATELKEQFPDAFERALERHRNDPELGSGWQGEIFDSLKAVCKAADVSLRDWSLGAYNRGNHIDVSFPGQEQDEVGELSGKRAFAWIENNLFGPLRIPWTGKRRAELRKYGSDYYAGKVKPCPLTGVCFDEDYLDALRKSIRQGDTLKEAFEGLADVYANLLKAEIESASTEEYFIEHAEANEMQFTEDGELF